MPTATDAVAASTAEEVTEGPDRSAPMMKTLSVSHRGWMCSATTSGSPRSSASAAARWPRTGSCTPTCACLAREGTPSFQPASGPEAGRDLRSGEHTSELQPPCNLVCRLLLEEKKINKIQTHQYTHNHTTTRHKLTLASY